MNSAHLILTVLSILFFTAGITRFFYLGRINIPLSFLTTGYGIAYLLYAVFYGVCYYLTDQGINYAVLYHLKYGLDGAGFGEFSQLIYGGLFILFLGTVVGSYFLFRSRPHRKRPSRVSIVFSILFLLLAVVAHPATVDWLKLSQKHDGEPFQKYYRTPYLQHTGSKKKNFIFIYLESLERTYFDDRIFPDLVKHLDQLEAENIAFTNIGGYPETGWTIAGMVASQCGIPLVSPSHGNSMGGMDSFLAGATCMGDLLHGEGYHLVYMGGAALEFAGKGKFYHSHGFSEVLDRYELTPLLDDQSYLSSWGLHDDSLFELAWEKFERLSNGDKPFGLYLLTLDTHGGDYISKSCRNIPYGDGKDFVLNGVACTDYLLNNFIDQVRTSPWSDDTLIIVASDHKAMRPGRLRKSKTRRNLFFIIDPGSPHPLNIDKKGSPLDIGSTVLHALGYRNYLGLGRDLLSDEFSIFEKIKHINKTLSGWRKDIMKLWSFPKIEHAIRIESEKGRLTIDDRTFSIPVLIQYDDNMQASLWFERYNSPMHKTLLEHLTDFSPESPFLLVHTCEQLPAAWTNNQQQGYCLISGKLGATAMKTEQITQPMLLTADQLRVLGQLPTSVPIYMNRKKQIAAFQKKKQ